ncbi:hypothetical protein [Streptomyces flavidovirens]|nr:hypothetical protein [Streptomyces flavidovirens]
MESTVNAWVAEGLLGAADGRKVVSTAKRASYRGGPPAASS